MEISPVRRPSTLVLYALIQLFCALITLNLFPIALRALTHGLLAALLARLIKAPWWWVILHGTLPILGWTLLTLQLSANVYLCAFAVLALFFGSGSLRRAPLFLSNKSAWSIAARHIPNNTHVLDAGCGFAGILHYLHHHRPDLSLTGTELAWLPYLISWIRCRNTSIRIFHRNFWVINWSDYDVIFAFLSPDPMPKVWQKFQQEMKPGSWLISYHFEVPDQTPAWVEEDVNGAIIYGWKIN